MSDERQEFSRRLADAMRARSLAPRPAVLHKLFNSRYEGTSVAFQTVSRWLRGKALPEQDKLQVLADVLNIEPHVLRFGNSARNRVGEAQEKWVQAMGPQDRVMMDAYLSLPASQRKLVREVIAALAAQQLVKR